MAAGDTSEDARVGLLGRQGQLPLFAGLLVLMLVGIATVWLVIASRAQNEWVAHTFSVQTRAAGLLSSMLQAETAERGYLLVGHHLYLRTYREGYAASRANLGKLMQLTADNPAQQRRLKALEPLISRRLADLDRAVTLAQAGRNAEAIAIVRTNRGKLVMDEVRRRLNAVLAIEAKLLAERADKARTSAYALLVITIAGLSLIVMIALLAYRSVRRYTTAIEAASLELQQLNTGLEARVAERTADLSAANEEIQRYAYIVSHDLRAPLVNIMGFTSELNAVRGEIAAFRAAAVEKAPELDTRESRLLIEEDLPEAIGFISASTSKMDRLINAILKISREGGRVLTPERVDMTALAEGAARAIHHQAGEATIEVAPLPPIVSDRLALEQVFGNLIENAIKYLDPARAGRVTVTGIERGLQNEYAISDNGRGIAAADHERVFDLFRRAGTQDRPGEGIGLAHVRALVRRLGGTITLRSEVGVGSTFTVTLPKTPASSGGRE